MRGAGLAPGRAADPPPADQESKASASSPRTSKGSEKKPNANKKKQKHSGSSGTGRSELIALSLLGVLLLGGAIWVLVLFFSQIPTAPKEVNIDYPVSAQFVTIGNVNTYWRRPIREQDAGVQQKARLIPAAIVTLAKPSNQGALRFFFESDSGKLIGDSSTRAFSQGVFAGNEAAEIEVHATGGFEDTGDHAAYVTGQIDQWHIIIKEGPDRNASGREFKEILRVPISIARK